MRDAVIVSGARTAIGGFGGAFKEQTATDLAAMVIKDAEERQPQAGAERRDAAAAPDKLKGQGLIELEKKADDWDPAAAPMSVDEVIMGNVLQAAQGQNPGRQAMIYAGLPKETPAFYGQQDLRLGIEGRHRRRPVHHAGRRRSRRGRRHGEHEQSRPMP